MKITPYLLAIVLFVQVMPSFGQTPGEEQPYIEVTGIAEMEVLPDEIFIGITIKEKYANKVKLTIEEQEKKLRESIDKLGMEPDRLVLSDADASYVKVNWKTKEVLTKKDYTLKVSDAAAVGQVFQELEKLEITDAFIARVNHSQMDSLRREVKIMAIKAAKTKASYLLEAIGEKLGKTLIIREIEQGMVFNSMELNEISRLGAANYYLDGARIGPKESGEIQFEKIRIQAGIYGRFSIQ